MTHYLNPHYTLWAPLSQAWERGRGRGLDIVTVYTDMISRPLRGNSKVMCMTEFCRFRRRSEYEGAAAHLGHRPQRELTRL